MPQTRARTVTAFARGKRRERPIHQHRLIRLDSPRLTAESAIRVIRLDLITRLMPPLGRGLDDPGEPRASCADAKCVAVVLNANA